MQAFGIVSGEFRTSGSSSSTSSASATVWHLANGIWLFAVDWGIVIGERAQRLTGYACIALGLLLLAVGINAQVAFLRPGGLLGGILY
jgi:succinate dehydrogenase/fumarate reductase cytochrome b subunit